MGLFSKMATTDDVLELIFAIRGNYLHEPGAGDAVDRGFKKVNGRRDNVGVMVETLWLFGQLMKKFGIDRERLEPVFIENINKIPLKKSDAAVRAINELGRALFLGGSQDQALAIIVQQGRDPSLSDKERADNVRDLVYVAGWIAAQLDIKYK